MVFAELDDGGKGHIPFEIIASRYNSKNHPEVVAGRLTSKQTLNSFLENLNSGLIVSGMVTRNEFFDYYTNIGACISSDDYFNLLLRSEWDMLDSATNLGCGSPVKGTAKGLEPMARRRPKTAGPTVHRRI
jgi:HKD family nuclease